MHLESTLGAGLGDDPTEDDFGARRFQAESTSRADDALGTAAFADHTKYFDHDTESLFNLGSIVNGDHAAVLPAEHRYDPWYSPVVDPEAQRTPRATETRPPAGG